MRILIGRSVMTVALGLTVLGVLVARSGAEPADKSDVGRPVSEPGEAAKPADAKQPKPGDRAMLNYTICPLYPMAYHGDYTTYYAEQCNPNHVAYCTVDSINNSPQGPCGVNTACIAGGSVLHGVGGDFLNADLATAGLTNRAPANGPVRLPKNVELLDTQHAWIAVPSKTPRAPLHVKLLLLKLTPNDSQGSKPRICGIGFEVATEGAEPSMSIDAEEITPIAAHALNLKIGSVSYRVMTHRDTPSIR